jgi:excisionase family DNA binding protein
MDGKLFLKPSEFATVISASRGKVYAAIADGSIPAVRIAGMIRIPAAFANDLAKRALETEDDAR